MPPATAMPSGARASPPAPRPNAIGTMPAIVEDCRHEDGPEARDRGLTRGCDEVLALLAELVGELDDEDRILGHEADQHDESDLAEQVDVPPTSSQGDERAREESATATRIVTGGGSSRTAPRAPGR
jgi:hypothetical protein